MPAAMPIPKSRQFVRITPVPPAHSRPVYRLSAASRDGAAGADRRPLPVACASLMAPAFPAAEPHSMTDTRLDVLCIGNAIVDIIADCDDAFLEAEGLTKGMMRLIDAAEATRLYDHMGPAREISGGSAGNTAAGVAALGGKAGFIGQVAPDQLGEFYRHDLTATGVEFITPAADLGEPTARSMVLVTPDAHRTMNTFLGAAQLLPPTALDEAQIEGAAVLYLEGYLWDPETPRYAMVKAIDIARRAGRKVAFTLSDTFCIDRHRGGFNQLLDDGRIDILF